MLGERYADSCALLNELLEHLCGYPRSTEGVGEEVRWNILWHHLTKGGDVSVVLAAFIVGFCGCELLTHVTTEVSIARLHNARTWVFKRKTRSECRLLCFLLADG